MGKGFFVTGTDTGIGKSWCSAALIWKLRQQGHSVAGMKPVASGCIETAEGLRNEDALLLQQLSSSTIPYNQLNPYAFKAAIAPHIAAEHEGNCIDLEVIKRKYNSISNEYDFTIVEGVGGWLVPLNDQQTLADLAAALKLPVIMVVGLRLGAINHALLTAHQIHQSGCHLAGWIANTPVAKMAAQAENLETLRRLIKAPLLGVVPHLENFDEKKIAASIHLDLL